MTGTINVTGTVNAGGGVLNNQLGDSIGETARDHVTGLEAADRTDELSRAVQRDRVTALKLSFYVVRRNKPTPGCEAIVLAIERNFAHRPNPYGLS
jgi:hypothetical protein